MTEPTQHNCVIVYDDLEYDRSILHDVVRNGISALGVRGHGLRSGMRVLVKPNVLAAVPCHRRVTTHPTLVWAVAKCLRDMGCSVLVSDSSGGGMDGLAQSTLAIQKTGIMAAAESAGAEAVALERFGAQAIPGRYGSWTLWLSRLLSQIDAVVNLPVMKTHTATVITGAVKNLFGLVPGHLKAGYHAQIPYIPMFARMLVDIAATVKPTVTIVDAIECMHGDGPMNGEPYAARKVVMSRDPYAIDHVLAAMAGVSPSMVPTIAAATAVGICRASADALAGRRVQPLEGFRLPQTVRNDWVGRLAFRIGIHWRRVEPCILSAQCTWCRQCEVSCPVGAIRRVRERLIIDHGKCMSCLCCHELCPSNAVELRRIPLRKRMFGFMSDAVKSKQWPIAGPSKARDL